MQAGRLDGWARIDAPADDGVDSMVAPKREWLPLWECPATFTPMSAREFLASNREGASASTRIVIRMPPPDVNVTTKCRVTDAERGVIYALEAVMSDEGRTYLTLYGVSGENDG